MKVSKSKFKTGDKGLKYNGVSKIIKKKYYQSYFGETNSCERLSF